MSFDKLLYDEFVSYFYGLMSVGNFVIKTVRII